MTRPQDNKSRRKSVLSAANRAWLAVLACVTCLYGSVVAYHHWNPTARLTPEEMARAGLMERCRQFCLDFGLVPSGNVAADAEAYVRLAKPDDTSVPLSELLRDESFVPAATQPHALLNEPAPNFRLQNDRGESVELRTALRDGPVVVVFYYGYWCSHCVAQLFALNEDLDKFRELHARVLAVSADPPEQTAERFQQYGRFDFHVLSDPRHATAQQYEVWSAERDDAAEIMLHGTFVVDTDGIVRWAHTGDKPFLDNRSLLHILSRLSESKSGAKQ